MQGGMEYRNMQRRGAECAGQGGSHCPPGNRVSEEKGREEGNEPAGAGPGRTLDFIPRVTESHWRIQR